MQILKMSDIPFRRNELIGLLLRLSLVSAATFFTLKWIMSYTDPTNKSKKEAKKKALAQLKRLKITGLEPLNDYELVIAAHLIHPEEINVSWTDIAGLDSLIQELRETVILPIQCKDLLADSKLTQAPKGVLLYGPPGCGKTLIAKATAKEAGTRFLNLNVSILTDKWYGESQRLAGAVFTLAEKLQPCIIFIDEIDSFLRIRSMNDHEATAMMKAQFMQLWDGLITNDNCSVIVMGATNRPSDLDTAILRRLPATFHIPLPVLDQRKKILKLILQNEPTSLKESDYDDLSRKTEGFSGSDLRELCRNATIYRVRDFMKNVGNGMSISSIASRPSSSKSNMSTPGGSAASGGGGESEDEFHDALRPITVNDLTASLHKIKESKMNCRTSALSRPDLD